MTIKQQGGIFGRNPTFNNVDVEGELSVSGEINATGKIDILETFGPSDLGQIKDTIVLSGTEVDSANLSGGEGCAILFKIPHGTNSSAEGARISNPKLSGSDSNPASALVFYTNNGTELTEAARFNNSGNLAFPSGQGIDFSATSGTGTSELFDDYEEGTWTPTNNGDSTGTVTASGKYTKTGNVVVLNAQVQIDTNFNSSTLGGLPYSVSHASGSPSSVQSAFPIMTNSSSGYAQVRRGESIIRMYASLSTSGGGFSPTTTDGVLRFTITYFTE